MKKFTLIAFTLAASFSVNAQTILTGGFGTTGMGIVNGNTYTKTGDLGSGSYAFVSASNDGTKFYASRVWDSVLKFIDVSTMTFSDSMHIFVRNLASGNETNTLFTINDKCLIRINTSTKSVTDSIVLGAPWLLEERPNSKEVWVSDSGIIHVVNYSSGLTQSTIHFTNNPNDNNGIRFTDGGTIGYKSVGNTRRIYKVNAVSKTILDSVSTPNFYTGAIAVSHDSSQIFVCDPTNIRIMVFSGSTLVPIDSIGLSGRVPMNIYTHPTRNEIWVVHHFSDSVSVFNSSTHALIAAFGISSSPWYLAFSGGVTGVNNVGKSDKEYYLFPNPAANSITLALPDDHAARKVLISDISGRVVIERSVTTVYESFNVANLAPGQYFVTVIQNNAIEKTIKWIKQ